MSYRRQSPPAPSPWNHQLLRLVQRGGAWAVLSSRESDREGAFDWKKVTGDIWQGVNDLYIFGVA